MKIGGVEFRSLKKEMRLKRWEKVIMYFYMGYLSQVQDTREKIPRRETVQIKEP